jgi:2,5-furandicarboxylate decarboxylase 1
MTKIDTEKFRLRRFVQKLDEMGEVTTIMQPVNLTDLAVEIEANQKAVLFQVSGT